MIAVPAVDAKVQELLLTWAIVPRSRFAELTGPDPAWRDILGFRQDIERRNIDARGPERDPIPPKSRPTRMRIIQRSEFTVIVLVAEYLLRIGQ
jgi:hypothetical protein